MSDGSLLPAEDQNLRGPYREYFTTKRNNFLAVVRDLPELWDCFLRLDEVWARELDNMRTVTEKHRPPIIAMFRHSHQQFRIAFELGFSTALTEALAILRGAIDTAMVAYKISGDPALLTVWLRKNDGKVERRAFKTTFNSTNLFPAEHGLQGLRSFYSDYSEYGTHPGVGAIVMHTTVTARVGGQDWSHTYLETDGPRTVAFLYRMLEAAALIEKACFLCFRDRLNLDTGLTSLRAKFGERKNHAAWVIANQILPANSGQGK